MPEWWDAATSIGGMLLALVLVLFLAWVALRFLNKRMPGLGGGGASRAIHVLDRVMVGKNSSVILLRVKDTVMLVAFSEHGVQKLYEFAAEEGEYEPARPGELPSFTAALRDAAKKLGKRGGGDGDGA